MTRVSVVTGGALGIGGAISRRPAAPSFQDSTPDQWQRLYELNLLHVFKPTHALLPAMIEHGSGAIVNNSTVEAFRGIPQHPVYSAFNAGVSAFTRSLAVAVGRHTVPVDGGTLAASGWFVRADDQGWTNRPHRA
ncbi:SDR family NAD(P)-dependent oxidoreductase [Actinomadura sp. LOL_016]|uniref:SDR family NAD(P)-dependent oxidoreductase n=1 Tax=unclassified Actinomadura TaxID=2626254 RepID=UPI003A7FA0E1